MPTLREVHPGDLITAELWNSLLLRLTDIETRLGTVSTPVPASGVPVPDVFGFPLRDARATLSVATRQLSVGFVIDPFGNSVDAGLAASQGLLVIGQAPPAGTRVNPGSSVNLAVQAPGTAPVVRPLRITRFEPRSPQVGQEVLIVGEGFATDPRENTVTFNGIAAPTPSTSSGSTLLVGVPRGIPGAPTRPTDPAMAGVRVIVRTAAGSSAEGSVDISPPPSERPAPRIDSITPTIAAFGAAGSRPTITIRGSGFLPDVAANLVRFTGLPAEGTRPESATEAQLVVILPEVLRGQITSAGVPRSFDVVVNNSAGASNTFPYNIARTT